MPSNIIVASSRNSGVATGSTRYSARKLAELALGQIGAYSVNDEGADFADMQRALDHLDMIIAELAGSDLNWWLVTEAYRFSWPAATRSDAMENIMGDEFPPLGIITPISATLLNEDGVLMHDLPLIRRIDYEAIDNKDETGEPEVIYFDRLATEPTVSVHPVPDVSTWQIDLTAQTYARSVLGTQGQEGQAGELQTGFGPEWHKYLVNQLSADTGNGPVRRVSMASVKDWRAVAEDSLGKLQAWSNRERKSMPSRTQPWGR